MSVYANNALFQDKLMDKALRELREAGKATPIVHRLQKATGSAQTVVGMVVYSIDESGDRIMRDSTVYSWSNGRSSEQKNALVTIEDYDVKELKKGESDLFRIEKRFNVVGQCVSALHIALECKCRKMD